MMTSTSRWFRENWLYLIIFILLLAFPYIVGALTNSSPLGELRGERMQMRGASVRWQAVMIEIFILSIMAMSYNLMFGFTGVLSFGHALFFGLGGYSLGLLLEYMQIDTLPALIIGVGIGIVVCGAISFLIGLVSLRLRGVYFAIFTLAVAEMGFIFFSRLALTRAEDGFSLTALPEWIDPTRNRLSFYYIALVLVVCTFLFIRRLINSPTGAVLKAVRENEDRAQSIGYNTLRYKLIAITIAGMMAAVAGMLQVLLNKKVGPELLAVSNTVDPLLMTIIGGIGTFSGPVIGAGGLHLLDTVLREASFNIGGVTIVIADVWGLMLGVIFIAVVLIFPQGIIGAWHRLRNRYRKNMPIASPAQPRVEEAAV